jgi:hypothetical protein
MPAKNGRDGFHQCAGAVDGDADAPPEKLFGLPFDKVTRQDSVGENRRYDSAYDRQVTGYGQQLIGHIAVSVFSVK